MAEVREKARRTTSMDGWGGFAGGPLMEKMSGSAFASPEGTPVTATGLVPRAAASDGPRAELSCVSCRKLKRKCSKELPTCSLCGRVGRECEYPSPLSSPDAATTGVKRTWEHANGIAEIRRNHSHHASTATRTAADSRPSSNATSPTPGGYTIPRTKFPSAWYIDSVTARGTDIGPTCNLYWSDVEVVNVSVSLDDAKQISDHFFRTTHEWLPVVSSMRLTRYLQAAETMKAADTVAVFTSMHLVSQGHDRANQPETQALMYRSLKAALRACEDSGQLTTNFLAAQVLCAMYEMGQGIYPAAYFSVGTCARTCTTLGLHDRRFATQLERRVDTWTEMEERRRLWWATLIMDRYVNIGFLLRPMCTPSIPANEIIPADDSKWDHGELAVNPVLVMSIETRSSVAPFARTCQAAHLLGRVSQHVSDHPSPSDPDFHFQEAHQIQRAATALLQIVQQEYNDTPIEKRHKLFTAMALCCSALLALYEPHSCIETAQIESGGRNKGMRMEMQQMAIDGFKRVSITIMDFADEIREASTRINLDSISPLVLNSLYQAAGTYA